MLTLYKYMVDNGMKELKDIPTPYQEMMIKAGYTLEEEAPAEE